MSRFEDDPNNSDFTKVINERILRKPHITSYALILHTLIDGQIYYLVGWVRDTIAFKSFLWGSIPPEDMFRYISQMSKREKQRLLNEDFQSLIDDVIVNHSGRNYKRICSEKEEFKTNVKTWRRFLQDPELGLDESPSTFPKGRKLDPREDSTDCALRETEEETHIPRDLVSIYDDFEPLEEIYTGLDNRLYKTVYFSGYISIENFQRITPEMRTKFIKTNKRISLSDEISKIKWLPYEMALSKLDSAKRYILRQTNTYLLFHLDRKLPARRHSIH